MNAAAGPAPPRMKAGIGPAGDVESALNALWENARYRLYSARNVWTWIDLNRRYQLRFLRPSQLHVEVPKRLLPDCESCVDLCCTGPNAIVTLRLRDIAALKDAGLEAHIERPADEEARTRVTTNEAQKSKKTKAHEKKLAKRARSERSWAQRSLDESIFRHAFPVLSRDETGTCRLLDVNRQCTAWPSWPLSCARYPYAIDVTNRVLFLAKGCQSHRLLSFDDAPDSVQQLVDAAVRGYNERVKDIILLHVALEELHALGLVSHLRLPPKLSRRLTEIERACSEASSGAASLGASSRELSSRENKGER